MRWYVEVSRVGENGVADEYCVEAKQWQAALQEARKLRGDSGALSKFSIELLDRGYRAVDPALKLRYLINEAPADAKLSEDAGKPPKVQAAPAPAKAAPAEAPTSLVPPVATAAASVIPRPSTQSVPRPQSVNPPRVASVAPPVASVAPRAQQLLVPDDPVPKAPRVPFGLTPETESSRPRLPAFELVRQRAEEPRPESPITYREFAYAVVPGATRAELEALLQDRYQATRAAIEQHPPGKFVQLAVFDHVFKRKPERPPLATFVWKDWRGAPIMAFPGFGEAPMGPVSQIPPARDSLPPNGARLSSMPPPAAASVVPPPPSIAAPRQSASSELAPSIVPDSKPLVPMRLVVLESKPAPAMAPASAPVEHKPAPERASLAPTAPTPIAEAAQEGPLAPASEPLDIPVTEEPIALVRRIEEPTIELPRESAPEEQPIALVRRVDDAQQPAPTGAEFELTFESAPLRASVAPVRPDQKSNPETARASRPRLGISRRRAGEDLIGELFELMHELHFMRDVAQGAEYVLAVIDEVLPCEGALIHVFDIDTGHFVVVRAKGPNAASVLLQRMSDQEPIVLSVMRSTRALSVEVASSDPRFAGPRWQALGVAPERALCGAVQQAGRYLGLIELANPQGDTPFHPTELNALDYICQQFADFLSQKPIVLTADVVLARA